MLPELRHRDIDQLAAAIARQAGRLLDRLERHGDAAHGVGREVDAVDRQERHLRHQDHRDGLRPPERTWDSAAALRNSSTTADDARRPVISGNPGKLIVTWFMPPPAIAGIASRGATRPPSAKRPIPSRT